MQSLLSKNPSTKETTGLSWWECLCMAGTYRQLQLQARADQVRCQARLWAALGASAHASLRLMPCYRRLRWLRVVTQMRCWRCCLPR